MGFLLLKPDHIPVLGASVGLGSPAEIDRLKDVGLSLGVIPIENICSAVKFQVKKIIISEIFNFKDSIFNFDFFPVI